MEITKTQREFIGIWNVVESMLQDIEKRNIKFLLILAEIKQTLKPLIEKLQTVEKTFSQGLSEYMAEKEKNRLELCIKNNEGKPVFYNKGLVLSPDNQIVHREFLDELKAKHAESLKLSEEYHRVTENETETMALPLIPVNLMPEEMLGQHVEILWDLIDFSEKG